MESGAIRDEQISASSDKSSDSAAHQARLNFKKTDGKEGSWTAGISNSDQYLTISFGGVVHTVTGVATQGKNGGNLWVTAYKLQYMEYVGDIHRYFMEQGQNEHKVR